MNSTARLGSFPTASPTVSSTNSSIRESPKGAGGKKSIFDRFKKGHKNHHEQEGVSNIRNSPSSTRSLQKSVKSDATSSIDPRDRTASVATTDSMSTIRASETNASETKKPRLPLGHGRLRGARRGHSYEAGLAKDPNDLNEETNQSLFHLDTDLSDMGDILAKPQDISPDDGGIFAGHTAVESTAPQKILDDSNSVNPSGAEWNAPDSWAVRKVEDENMTRLREIDEEGVAPKDEDDGMQYSGRVFRIGGTFATLSTGLNSTVAEILGILGKKSFLQASLEDYQIVMKKHDMQRILEKGERPLAIQKRLLNQAGYHDNDRLDEIGREDNSYLCRFTFVPAKLSNYYSLEKDPGFSRMHKFSRVDLQGRNLIAIPITLYQKATEIVSLNLSRNLSLDIPKDFIQSCLNLRDIKYTSNEAWKLPPSLSLAARLTFLDISNNRLEQLEHAGLEKLQSLLSLKMSNNKISRLPSSFGHFRELRTLNISSNYLEVFPEFLCDLTSLVDLDLSFNSISSFPENIGKLISLEKLAATNNKFVGPFPDAFASLVKLREVDVRFNNISNVDVCSQLPLLEQLIVGHNSISAFEGTLHVLRTLTLSHNPVTRFAIKNPVPSLTKLNLGSAKLAQLPDELYEKIPNLESLILDKNHFVSLSPQIGKLQKLQHLSVARNPLNSLPPEIGCLHELHILDVREGNLKKLPGEIWCMFKLDTLNVSSNVLETFPKPATIAPNIPGDTHFPPPMSRTNTGNAVTPTLSSSPSFEELGRLEDFGARRPSQASGGLLSVGSSPAASQRNGSIVSVYGPGGRKASVFSRTTSDGQMTPIARKDSNISNKVAITFAASLKHLYLADNRLNDDAFDYISMLPELRVLNLSYNELYDMPSRSLARWPHLSELYLSGNELSSLPSEDFDEQSCLKILHLNGNRFQVLPAELGKLHKLTVLDCGSNSLKYNVSNWPYDWNWNWNVNLKYLNLSGNKRLEIKPNTQNVSNRQERDLTDFGALHHLRVLGLMDVTLTIPTVPDQTEDRRVRTSGSLAGVMTYGMADSLGKHDHLSIIDMVVPRFRGHEGEALLGMFDGQVLSSGGSKVAKFLHENFGYHFNEELGRMLPQESPMDALRRTFLALNKDLATAANQNLNERPAHLIHRGSVASTPFTQDDLKSGGVATVMYLCGMDLYVANVGDAQAMLLQSDGGYRVLTRKHDPAETSERQRIREAGGYVSLKGKLNDQLDVSRAFGYIEMMPAVQASPHIAKVSLKEQDEMIVIASKELWEYLSLEYACDVARSERGDLMRAAQKLRDLAIAFGASNKIMVMMLGVSDLKKRERNRYRGQSLSMGPSGVPDELLFPTRSAKRRIREGPDDSGLARLDPEVFAPTGELSIVFTDIKNSTMIWETYPVAMRAAIKIHNDIMRRQLRIIGGYEVKTEGDAFMVSFPTATSALLWTFSLQSQLLEAPWPQEVLDSVHGAETHDADGNVIYRGLSVRMGIHWGNPVCEPDPVTRRMDYFGPMVNRASRISSVADGGQITVSSDFIGEIKRALETYSESDRNGSTGSDDTLNEDLNSQAIRKELRLLSSQGFEVKDLGERKLKGLENPEYVYLMYPHSLAGRLLIKQQQADAIAASAANDPGSLSRDSQLAIDTDAVWGLWNVSLRLEMLCSTLESPGCRELKAPETALLERMQNRGGELTDRFLVNLVEHQVSRIEVRHSSFCRSLLIIA